MEATLFCCTLIASIWLWLVIGRAATAGERIADELKRLREIAEGRRP